MDHSLSYGVFNFNELSIIACKIQNCFVIGSFCDYVLFLDWFINQREILRCQLILRDFEPHFLCVDLWLTDYLYIFVFDSAPEEPINWRKYSQHPRSFPTRVFLNSDLTQTDDISCKLFAAMSAFRLSKIDPNFLYEKLSSHSKQVFERADMSVRIVDQWQLPGKLYRGCQSMAKLQQVLQTQPNEKALMTYVNKRSVFVIWDDDSNTIVKTQNRTMNFKLEKYRKYILLSKAPYNAVALGWDLPIIGIQVRRGNMLSISAPIVSQLYAAKESPYSENNMSWLHLQTRETDLLCENTWEDNILAIAAKQKISQKYWLNAPIIQESGDKIIVSGSLEFWREELSDIKRIISRGCVSLLTIGQIRKLINSSNE